MEAFEIIKNYFAQDHEEWGSTLEGLYNESFDWSLIKELQITNSDVECVHDWNKGDGNECGCTFFIEKFNLYFSVSGYYSSWGDDQINKIYQVYPHIECKIKYRNYEQSHDGYLKEFNEFKENWNKYHKE